jgi:hypothetical protein
MQEFSRVWYWRPSEHVAEKGPLSIRDLRELLQDLEGHDMEEMLWAQVYTKADGKRKFVKHLLRFGDAQAYDPSG